MIQPTLWMIWLCPVTKQWRTSSGAAPFLYPVFAGLLGHVGRHARETGQAERLLLYILKHGVEDLSPSCGVVQWNKLKEFLLNQKGSSDSENENCQLGCVLHVGTIIKSKREKACTLRCLVSLQCDEKQSGLKDYDCHGHKVFIFFLRTEESYHNHDALLWCTV